MFPLVTLIGRSNVGKSTLFNKLTCSKNALVSNIPELTRDRKYGCLRIENKKIIISDTSGISSKKKTLTKKF
ncbi:GTPase [Buchnera aphidicola]|uniref:GTPase n=1 Tax=Buchnera aphidicola TaxID=9 RepID=UPI0009E38F2A|nr:GTPase [Buchnera aphidicola]